MQGLVILSLGKSAKFYAEISKHCGFRVACMDYTGIFTPKQKVQHLVNECKRLKMNEKENVILVGSSIGAYVSLHASSIIRPKGMFLMSPVLKIQDNDINNINDNQHKPFTTEMGNIEIIQGWNDTTVDKVIVMNYCRRHWIPRHLFWDERDLKKSLKVTSVLFERFLVKNMCNE